MESKDILCAQKSKIWQKVHNYTDTCTLIFDVKYATTVLKCNVFLIIYRMEQKQVKYRNWVRYFYFFNLQIYQC